MSVRDLKRVPNYIMNINAAVQSENSVTAYLKVKFS